ncbi:MAG: DUF4430 domain-containing protein [Clostridia bacterium]|nr:DUF4430 domain-containing protein [Clostridia bacterium]
MKKTNFKKSLICILSFVLIAVIALTMFGCGKTDEAKAPETTAPVADTAPHAADKTVLGEGATVFDFAVTGADGNTTSFEIHTDEKTVGDALIKLELIQGEDSEYGLYVKTVNGITYDYDADGKYWAFYENGAYANAGVDSTPITDGAAYEFKAE